MKKKFQTGLAIGLETNACMVCNIDFSWLFSTPSNLLWIDKVLVTRPLWNLISKYEKEEVNANNNDKREIQNVTAKLIFQIMNSLGYIEIIDGKQISDQQSSMFYDQINNDFDLLEANGMMTLNEDHHMFSIGNFEYCVPRLWTLYASIFLSRKYNSDFSLSKDEFSYLKALLPLKLSSEVKLDKNFSAINTILEMSIPEIKIWPEYLCTGNELCCKCRNLKKCDDSYLTIVEKNIYKIFDYRNRDEIKQFCDILDKICDVKFKDRYEVDANDLLRELNIEKIKAQKKLNRTYKQVKKWSKIIGTISAGFSLGAFFNHPELVPIGGIGMFASSVANVLEANQRDKYKWVNFMTQNIIK